MYYYIQSSVGVWRCSTRSYRGGNTHILKERSAGHSTTSWLFSSSSPGQTQLVIVCVFILYYNNSFIVSLYSTDALSCISQMPIVLIPIHFDRDPQQRPVIPSCQRSVVIRTFITSDFMTGIPATPGKHLPMIVSSCLLLKSVLLALRGVTISSEYLSNAFISLTSYNMYSLIYSCSNWFISGIEGDGSYVEWCVRNIKSSLWPNSQTTWDHWMGIANRNIRHHTGQNSLIIVISLHYISYTITIVSSSPHYPCTTVLSFCSTMS